MLVQKGLDSRVRVIRNGAILADLGEVVTMRLMESRAGIRITDLSGRSFDFWLQLITETQILPDPAVPFSGSIYTLWQLLTTFFFTELHTISGGGSGGLIEDGTTVTGTYTILPTDERLIAGADTTVLKLPTIDTTFGRVYKVWADRYTGTRIDADTGATDKILDQDFIILNQWEMVTLRCFRANVWLIGD